MSPTALSAHSTGEYPIVPAAPAADPVDEIGWALVARVQAGDDNAFGEFYLLYHQQVYHWLRRRKGEQWAHDYTSEVFFRAWRGIHRLHRTARSPVAWLYMIARNMTLDYSRSGHPNQREVPNIDAVLLDTPTHGDVAEQVAHWLDFRRDFGPVARALAALPLAQQQVVVDRFFYGLSTVEVADKRQTTVGAVKATLHRAVSTLRRALGGRP